MLYKKFLGALLLPCFMVITYSSCKENDSKAKELKEGLAASSTLPNIIYILADDLGYGDLGCYGQNKFNTPNIDKMAFEGMLFEQHYSGSTVCAPSRSALLTGMHTGHTPVRGNLEVFPEGQFPLPKATVTLAEHMKAQGYRTGAFGKWGLGYPGSEGDPTAQGFDVFYGYNCQRYGHHYYPRHLWSNRDSVVLEDNQGLAKGSYAPALIHEKTLSFIEDSKDQPFFLYVPSIIPHAELVAPEVLMKKHRGLYATENAYDGVDGGADYRTGPYESQAEPRAAFAAMVTLLDQQVGEIVAKLESLGLSENTIIIFTSDNGPHQEGGADPDYFNSNGPLRGYKRDLYEGGIRVPMIVKWPNKISGGQRTDHVSAFWDVLPTFLDITGGESPKDVDGISFLPTLLGDIQNQRKHKYLYWEFHEKGGRQAVRMQDWKGVKYDMLDDANAPLALYDLSKDMGETKDVADQNPEVVKQLEDLMRTARNHSDVFTFEQTTYLGQD